MIVSIYNCFFVENLTKIHSSCFKMTQKQSFVTHSEDPHHIVYSFFCLLLLLLVTMFVPMTQLTVLENDITTTLIQ